jgi:surface antigen
VVDSQGHPPRDGLDHLFGDSAFDQLIGGTTSVPIRNPATSTGQSATPARNPATGELPSRRELRTASTSRSRASGKPPKAPKRGRQDAQLSRKAPQAFVRPSDSAYPVNRVIVVRRAAAPVRKKSRGRGFLTILAVVGLFGSVAIPAYAFAPNSAGASPDSAAELATADVSLKVADDTALTSTARGEFHATTAFELKNQRRTSYMDANFANYMLSGAREKGDDYPWFSELSNNQGGGISPLNYFYRECVDFVAWRLNRDAGSTSAPFLWDWSSLTPSGGNAYQWKRAWLNKGWPTSTTPIAGAVAWYSYGHVAYVKSVNGDGTITVEDYNQSGMHIYDQRVVAANDANLYLYPPPH